MSKTWSPSSWRKKLVIQQPDYPDADHLQDTLKRLAKLPPLVTSWEVENLKSQLAEAAEGNAFLLQGGDCSESLEDCETDSIVRNPQSSDADEFRSYFWLDEEGHSCWPDCGAIREASIR